MSDMGRSRAYTDRGPSQRQLRVGELIRRTLSEVLARGDLHDPTLARVPITVSEVRTSPDLRIATAFVMPLGGQEQAETLTALRRNTAELRHLVGRGLTLKYTPDLRFQIDESFERMDETRRLLQDERVQRDLDSGPDEDAQQG